MEIAINESDLLIRLRAEESAAYELLYQFCYPSVRAYITKNNGTAEDAKDIFQESIIVLVESVRRPEFRLTASLKTYLFAVSRNIWLKRLRILKNIVVADEQALEGYCEPSGLKIEIKEGLSFEDKLSGWFKKITQHCQNLLRFIFLNNEPMDKIMTRLGYKSKHSADNQKYKCLEQVRKAADINKGGEE